ncbi:LPXTG cell wall anchor domain-containing protein [Micromonospora sp. CPCC 205539]|uniref:LPXTG cell wall anchor domain-containing protein n=1 Tax=Micromonospora sp. CPCC 205539 TaxID=3122408 RepID=UPI002FEFD138
MHPSPVRRLLAGLAVVGALVTASTSIPAAAAPPADIALYANPAIVAVDGPHKYVTLLSPINRSLGKYTVRVDRSAVAGFAQVVEGEGRTTCTTAGEVITCAVDSATEEDNDLLTLEVRARPGATVGQRGDLVLTVTSPGVGTDTYRSTVSIGEGVDLAAGPDLDLNGKLGGQVGIPLTVANRGAKTAHGMVLYVTDSYGFTLSKRYENCEYGKLGTACTFDDSLAPGAAVRVDSTFGGTIPTDSWAPNYHYGWAYWFTPADWEEYRSQYRPAEPFGEKGTDAALRLVPLSGAQARAAGQTDVSFVDNDTSVTVRYGGDQRTDAAAVGATVTGKVGTTVPLSVGYTNNGPARAGGSGQQAPEFTTMVTLPAGVTAVTVSKLCVDPYDDGPWQPGKPGARFYECHAIGTIPRGERATFEFRLRIDRAGSQTGKVELRPRAGEGPVKDLNPANDTAKIVINSTGGGSGGGGSLPVTGASVGLIAGLGGLLIVAGVGGYLLARRRQNRFVA